MTHIVFYEVKEDECTEELRIVDAKNQKEAKLFAKKFCAERGYTPVNIRFTKVNKRTSFNPISTRKVEFKPYAGFEEDIKKRGYDKNKEKKTKSLEGYVVTHASCDGTRYLYGFQSYEDAVEKFVSLIDDKDEAEDAIDDGYWTDHGGEEVYLDALEIV